jgi:hypothetical protein
MLATGQRAALSSRRRLQRTSWRAANPLAAQCSGPLVSDERRCYPRRRRLSRLGLSLSHLQAAKSRQSTHNALLYRYESRGLPESCTPGVSRSAGMLLEMPMPGGLLARRHPAFQSICASARRGDQLLATAVPQPVGGGRRPRLQTVALLTGINVPASQHCEPQPDSDPPSNSARVIAASPSAFRSHSPERFRACRAPLPLPRCPGLPPGP